MLQYLFVIFELPSYSIDVAYTTACTASPSRYVALKFTCEMQRKPDHKYTHYEN